MYEYKTTKPFQKMVQIKYAYNKKTSSFFSFGKYEIVNDMKIIQTFKQTADLFTKNK